MAEAIEFDAAVSQVRTLADGGIRVVLDLPEDAIPQMAMLAECKRQGIYLTVNCSAKVVPFTELDDEARKEPKRRASKVGRRRS